MRWFWHLLLLSGAVVVAAVSWTVAFPENSLSARILELSVAGAGSYPAPRARTVYQYVDATGIVRMVESLESVPADRRASAGRFQLPLEAPEAGAPPTSHASTSASIVVYTTSWCGYCRKMIEELDRQGLDYTQLDIERDRSARDELLELVGSTAVPVTVFDGEVIRGYDPSRLKRLAARRR